VYDAGGRRVRTLIHGPLDAGPQQVAWTGLDDAGRALPPGIFFVRIRADEYSAARRVLLLR
jgi:hypothetical protein